MKKWRYTAVAAVVLVATVAVVWWSALHEAPDPVYQGKPLSVWLQDYGKSQAAFPNPAKVRAADTAVRNLGTNTIPLLLRMLRSKDSTLKLAVIKLAQKQPLIKISPDTAADRIHEAGEAFRALGASASNAVPDLIKICQTNPSPVARSEIAFSLGEIRAEPAMVVPVLTAFLHDPNSTLRASALQSLGNFGVDAKPATSGLLELAEDMDSQVGQAALRALGQIYARPAWNPFAPPRFNRTLRVPDMQVRHHVLIGVINDFGRMGTNAAPAVPALVAFLAHQDDRVRVSAANALKAISPEIAAKAGAQ